MTDYKTPTDSHDWTSKEIVSHMIGRQAAAIEAVSGTGGDLSAAIDDCVANLRENGRFIFVGAGTSGRLAAQDAAELPPTFNWPKSRALVLIAGGLDALHTPVERAEDNADRGGADMRSLSPGPHDIAVGVAASGTTPYTIAALRAAREAGATTIAITNAPGAPIRAVADHFICPATGPEFVHGSTRLAAGTAQKAALNILTTATMVRLGRVYCGHMVEMPPTNAKLEARAVAIVADISGCSEAVAAEALSSAGQSVKTAIVMIRKSLSRNEAEALLDQVGGRLADAL